MPCPVCNRTLANLGLEGRRVFHCGTCGTVVMEDAGENGPQHVTVPSMVRSVRAAFDAGVPIINVQAFGFFALVHPAYWRDIADYAGRKVV